MPPKIKLRPASVAETVDTSFQTYLTADYKDLVAVFGEPTHVFKEDKVRVLWGFILPSGHVATVYDYKSEVPVERHRTWHVGSAVRFAAIELLNIFKEALHG